MSAPIQRGTLLLADLSGYTSYIAAVELDHAHEILTDLIETVIGSIRPVLTISKLEGDAVFAYGADESLSRGEALLELVEATYTAFRDRRQAIQRRTTCTCRACSNIPALDLKFIVHHGDYLLQKVHTVTELVGTDVNLAHRLMKNGISQATGWKAYAMYTEAVLAYMGISLPGAYRQVESVDSLGDVAVACVDLHQRYDELAQARRIFLAPEDADRVLEFDYEAAPPVVWEWFNDPARRSQWMGAQIVPVRRVSGRVAAGARNHCVHGKNEVVVEDILDLKPFDYYTVEHRPQGSRLALRMTFHFTPARTGGTHLVLTFRAYARGLPRWAGRLVTGRIVDGTILHHWSLSQIDELIRRAGPVSSAPEPALPAASPRP